MRGLYFDHILTSITLALMLAAPLGAFAQDSNEPAATFNERFPAVLHARLRLRRRHEMRRIFRRRGPHEPNHRHRRLLRARRERPRSRRAAEQDDEIAPSYT